MWDYIPDKMGVIKSCLTTSLLIPAAQTTARFHPRIVSRAEAQEEHLKESTAQISHTQTHAHTHKRAVCHAQSVCICLRGLSWLEEMKIHQVFQLSAAASAESSTGHSTIKLSTKHFPVQIFLSFPFHRYGFACSVWRTWIIIMWSGTWKTRNKQVT